MVLIQSLSAIGSGTRGLQKGQLGSNERKYCEDGLGTKIYLHRRSRWVLLVVIKKSSKLPRQRRKSKNLRPKHVEG